MRKVFLDNLPKRGNRIDWENSIGYKVKFIYDEICGYIKIICYKKTEQSLKVTYNNNEPFSINTGSFRKCNIGTIIGTRLKTHKYNIGDIVTVKSGYIQILEQNKIEINKILVRCYNYLCLNCYHKNNINESNLSRMVGCPVCSGKKVKIGVNDIWTTNSNLAKLLENSNDGFKFTQYSDQRVNWKCPECNHIIMNKKIHNICAQGLPCPKCSDGISYPEKFMMNFLDQLNIYYEYQISKNKFKWCNNYRYDFYIPSLNCIIETHGLQHYEESTRGKSLKEEQENDKCKKELALKNGVEHYIIIDCRYSRSDYIKNSIVNSELNNIFNSNDINWIMCDEFACKTIVKRVGELWSLNKYSVLEISKILKIHRATTVKFLKQANELNLCNYDPKIEIKKRVTNQSIKIVQLSIDNKFIKIYNSIEDAGRSLNNVFAASNISKKCKLNSIIYKNIDQNLKVAYGFKWMFKEDYDKLMKTTHT